MFQFLVCCVIIYCIINWVIRLPRLGGCREKYVFITGCDTGFGNLLAKRLDNLEFNVFAGCLTEKGKTELNKQSSGRLKAVLSDVTSDESIEETVQFVKDSLPANKGLWGLVNNAGIVDPHGPIEWLQKQHYQKILDVNLFGLISVTKAFTPLLAKGRGRVVNMSSMAGIGPCAYFVAYRISKHGVEVYSDELRRSMKKYGVGVSIIEPALFRTGILRDASGLRRVYETTLAATRWPGGQAYCNKVDKFIQGHLHQRVASAKLHSVIDAYEHALTALFPKSRYTVGWPAKFLQLFAFFPTWVFDALHHFLDVVPDIDAGAVDYLENRST